jgi:hypothetical protein
MSKETLFGDDGDLKRGSEGAVAVSSKEKVWRCSKAVSSPVIKKILSDHEKFRTWGLRCSLRLAGVH